MIALLLVFCIATLVKYVQCPPPFSARSLSNSLRIFCALLQVNTHLLTGVVEFILRRLLDGLWKLLGIFASPCMSPHGFNGRCALALKRFWRVNSHRSTSSLSTCVHVRLARMHTRSLKLLSLTRYKMTGPL